MSTTITLADYSNPAHQTAIIKLLDEYAKDPMGGGKGLSNWVKENLLVTLADTAMGKAMFWEKPLRNP